MLEGYGYSIDQLFQEAGLGNAFRPLGQSESKCTIVKITFGYPFSVRKKIEYHNNLFYDETKLNYIKYEILLLP